VRLGIALVCAMAAAFAVASDLDQARALILERRLDEARAILDKTVTDPALKGESLVLLTRVSNFKGDYETGIAYGKQVVALLPASSEAHYEYAVALRIRLTKVGKLKAMMSLGGYKDELARAIELDPRNVAPREEEIGFLLDAPGIAGGDVEKARKKIVELKAVDWKRGARLEVYALRKEGNKEGAIVLLTEILAKDPNDRASRFTLATTLQEAGRFKDAEQELNKLAQVQEGTWALAATYQLARTRILGQYEPDRAVELLLDFIAKVPDKAQGLPGKSSAYWRLGNAYEQLKQPDKARQAYEKAIALDPENKEAAKALKALRQ